MGRPSFGCAYTHAPFGFLIRAFTSFRGEPPAFCNHTMNIRRDGISAVESTWRGTHVVDDWRSEYDDDAHWGVLVEVVGFSDRQWERLQSKTDEYVGETYGKIAVTKHALDGILGWLVGRDVYLFRRIRAPWSASDPGYYNICSWLTAYTHAAAAWIFRDAAGDPLELPRVSPDDIFDDVFEHRPASYRIRAEFGRRPDDLPSHCVSKITNDLHG